MEIGGSRGTTSPPRDLAAVRLFKALADCREQTGALAKCSCVCNWVRRAEKLLQRERTLTLIGGGRSGGRLGVRTHNVFLYPELCFCQAKLRQSAFSRLWRTAAKECKGSCFSGPQKAVGRNVAFCALLFASRHLGLVPDSTCVCDHVLVLCDN